MLRAEQIGRKQEQIGARADLPPIRAGAKI